MPEGDTILRTARTLQKVLGGKAIAAAESPRAGLADARLAGRTVEKVEARGKNLLIRFDDGRVLHTHMRMTGSWHVYRPGERWQKPRRACPGRPGDGRLRDGLLQRAGGAPARRGRGSHAIRS